MDKTKLENKALSYREKWDKVKELGLNPDGRSEEAVNRVLSEYDNKQSESTIYVCTESFPGLPNGHQVNIDSKERAKRLIDKGYVKIKD